jgi:hypothetical protein
LKKLEIDLGADSKALRGQGVSVPQATAVQRAKIDAEVRSLADDVSTGLGAPFADSVRRASTARLSEVGDRLDDALRTVDLDAERLPVWAGAVRVLQWLLVLVCRGLVAATARSRAAAADRRLREAVSEVASELVVAPVQTELTAYTSLRTGLDRALA